MSVANRLEDDIFSPLLTPHYPLKGFYLKTRFISLTLILLIGLAASVLIYNITYTKLTQDLPNYQQKIEAQYAQQISTSTNAYNLTKSGLRQFNANMPTLALISLKQATKTDPNYRDGWISLALVQIELKDYSSAIETLKNAEKIDPIFPKTYELLTLCYTKTNNPDLAKAAQTKFDFLNKK